VEVTRGGTPDDEEMAAIIAAIEVTTPRAEATASPKDEPPRWRFAGRWWSKPIPVRRDRPR
jgi:hypothetical protein